MSIINREELKGFRNPTKEEHNMIYSYLEPEFRAEKNRFSTMRLVIAVIGAVIFVTTIRRYTESRMPVVLLIGMALMILWGLVYKSAWKTAQMDKYRCEMLEEAAYRVKEVQVKGWGSRLDTIGGELASICDEHGRECSNWFLVRQEMERIIVKRGNKALLMKSPDGTFYRLFARAEDWNRHG